MLRNLFQKLLGIIHKLRNPVTLQGSVAKGGFIEYFCQVIVLIRVSRYPILS